MKTRALRNAISIALFATLHGHAATLPNPEPLAGSPDADAQQDSAQREDAAGQGTAAAGTPPVQDAAATELETVTVTGTRLRGGITPSPVIAIGSERIRQEGFSTLGEVVRSLPQNFNGGQNPGVVSATGSGNMYNQNAGGGSSLNLRGIGPDATLTLLNGRRLAYGGLMQAVDISAIPVAAVERVDIVADGASAIYGSDAVAGVGNVILKRDMEGAVLSARYGRAAVAWTRASTTPPPVRHGRTVA